MFILQMEKPHRGKQLCCLWVWTHLQMQACPDVALVEVEWQDPHPWTAGNKMEQRLMNGGHKTKTPRERELGAWSWERVPSFLGWGLRVSSRVTKKRQGLCGMHCGGSGLSWCCCPRSTIPTLHPSLHAGPVAPQPTAFSHTVPISVS